MNNAETIADARGNIEHIHWYVFQYTPSIPQQAILSKQTLSSILTELRYTERSVLKKKVNGQNLWHFELGNQESMNVPTLKIVGFQQRDWQESKKLNTDTFCRLPVTSAQCIIGTEKHRDTGILLNFDDDFYSQNMLKLKKF